MRRFALVLATFVATPLMAQQQPFINELPGMGRPVDIAATSARRQRLMDKVGDAVIVIHANSERQGEPDGEYSQDNDFRQHNTFFYFTMLETAGAYLIMNAHASGADEVVLVLPPRVAARERWTGVRVGPDSIAARLSGIATVVSTEKLDSVLTAARARNVPFYLSADRTTRPPQSQPVINALRADTVRGLVVRSVRPMVDSMRHVKDAQEIAMLRRAAQISAEAHVDLMRGVRPGMFEYEMEAIIEAGFRRRGADRVGYPSIVGSGINATTLHYDVNRRQSQPNELVVVDAAAEIGQYTADVTRTFPVSGRFTDRQRAIYNLVLGSQQAVMDSVRPGITFRRLGQIAADYMRTHSGTLCGAEPCNRYYIHSMGHWIGMDVHDVSGPGGADRPLEPGMTFAIEPGIYIPEEGFGVRIEDNVLVTERGYELLTRAAPRTAEEVERVMRGRGTT